MNPHAHRVLRVVEALVAALMFAAALALWRLASGPIPLDWLAADIAAALVDRVPGDTLTIDHALVALADGARIELVARGVHLQRTEGGARLDLPEVAIELDLWQALRGRLAPTRIVFERPFLRINRDPDGSFEFGIGSGEATASEDWGRRLLEDLANAPDRAAPLGSLRTVAVNGAGLLVDDRALSAQWRAQGVELQVGRDEDEVHGELGVTVRVANVDQRIEAAVDYRRRENRLAARVGFTNIVPAVWAAAAPALAPLGALNLPVTGTFSATLDPTLLTIVASSCELAIGAGSVAAPDVPGGTIAVTGGAFAADYDPGGGRVVITHAALALGRPSVSLSGTIDGVGGDLLTALRLRTFDAGLALEAHDVPVATLPQLWPAALAPKPRQWVLAHIASGVATSAAAQLGLRFDRDAPDPLMVRTLAGTMAYRDLVVEKVAGLPPLRGIDGTATFDRTSITFAAAGGSIADLRASDAKVTLDRLDAPRSRADIALSLSGSLAQAIALLDAEPFRYGAALGIAPKDVGGNFTAKINVGLVLDDAPGQHPPEITADAKLSGVTVARAILGRDLAAGAIRLRLDRAAVQLDGTASLAGVPMTGTLTRSLDAKATSPLRATVRATLDDAQRRTLGLGLADAWLHGAIGVDLAYQAASSGAAEAQLNLDLARATIAVPELSWHKAAGIAATAQSTLSLDGGRVTALRSATLSGGGLEARLSATFGAGAAEPLVTRADLARLVVGATDASASLVASADGGWQIAVTGASVDASGLKDMLSRGGGGTRWPPLAVTVKLDRLRFGSGREVTKVSARLASDADHWQTATVDATLAGGAPLRLRLGMVAGKRHLGFDSGDFGGLLKLFDVSDDVRGGRVHLAGVASDNGPRRRYALTLDATDYRVVNLPLLAQILSLASFSGITALLGDQGIPFTRLTADLTDENDRIALNALRAYGGAIGVTANGIIDRQAGTLDLSGTLVPAYRLNSIIGSIPLIGNLLVGGEGGGMFAANFRVAGSFADPKVAVNPLSALAPGALRELFLFKPRNPAPPPADAGR